jgi:hypothetical protein
LNGGKQLRKGVKEMTNETYEHWAEVLSDCKILKVSEYKTPATDYALKCKGEACLERHNYKRGLFVMEGVNGYDFFWLDKPVPVTNLKIKGKTWMVDDVLHNEGMKALAEHSKGKVVIGGLGLGLLAHHLHNNPKVSEITIYERSKDVINLMKDNLPKGKISIKNEDIYRMKGCPDTIILDIWVGKTDIHTLAEFMGSIATFKKMCPVTPVYIWGSNEPSINPAVTKKPCEFLRDMKLNQF